MGRRGEPSVLLLLVLSGALLTVDAGIFDSIKCAFGICTTPSSSISASSGNNVNLPPYFRIECEIDSMENLKGMKSTGGSCDTIGECDPILYASVDLEQPSAAFPGGIDVKNLPEVFRVENKNGPAINKVVSKDLCNKELTKATLRVHVMDHNTLLSDSLISDFDCVIGGSVANSLQEAKWSDVKYCVGKYQPDKIKLKFRSRMYRISPQECVANNRVAATTASSKSIFG